MRRRSRILTALILGTTAAAVLGTMGVLLKQEPDFYTVALAADHAQDPFVAAETVTRLGDLKNDVRGKADWTGAFTADELNALLREYASQGGLLDLLPAGCYDPRVAIDGDRLKIAAKRRQFGLEALSTVVSFELRAWMVPEVNTVAVEIVDVRAGALPVRPQPWLDRLTEVAHGWNTDVTWYRHDGHPVGLFRFYANQVMPTTQVRAVVIGDGQVMIAGRTGRDAGPR